MMSSSQAWLPPIALFDGVLSGRVGGLVAQWEKRWIGRPKGLSTRIAAEGAIVKAHTAAWGTHCGGLVAAIEEAALVRLACQLLCIKNPPKKMQEADAHLLRSVGEACLRNLLTDLAAGLGLSGEISAVEPTDLPGLARNPAMRFILNPASLPRGIDLFLSQDAAVSARKMHLAPPREPRPLGARRAAAEAQEIRVGACIGWGQVGLSDLRSLMPDDVIVLDGALGKDLVLHVDGRATADPLIELAQSGPALVLRERKMTTRAA
ncbi:MAG TPA: hypothetical protein VGO52_06240 [Hyphomonadaceae bacterium]|jgi:hypothetical protein|nr:hypothetical protein [Hyphomonadaceae bacterium]